MIEEKRKVEWKWKHFVKKERQNEIYRRQKERSKEKEYKKINNVKEIWET